MNQSLKYLFLLFLFACLSASCGQQSKDNYSESIKEFRKEYLQGFLDEERSPLESKDFKNISFFVADSAYKVIASYQLTPEEQAFDIKTSSGKIKEYRKYAKLEFELNDDDYSLFVYESMKLREMDEYKDYLFLPFTDYTNGESTYGGGRYLDLNKYDLKEGKVLIDFNKCYNPWCAYSDGYNCPVPPSENDLYVDIFAGERMYSGEHKTESSKK